ncbi:MAG: hypothetical protein LQ340_007710 [Diploschistes diacapsis]|nr:MAG: hypothetical protein LQ340_007710 [Diploschistes diacapsis]
MKTFLTFVSVSFSLNALAYKPNAGPGCHSLSTQIAEHAPSQVLKIGTSNNGVREYILDLPQSWKVEQPSPLIIAFHGKNQENLEFRKQTQLSEHHFNNEAIVAYPQAIDKQWTGDPASPPLSQIDDIKFAGHLIEHVTQIFCVDMRRIYAVGFSNGGGLTQLLACDPTVSSKLAAVAIASGAFYLDESLKEPLFGHCTPAHTPLPAMEFHGTKDPVIHYHGKGTPDGQTFDIANWGPTWAERNGCQAGQESENTMLFGNLVERMAWKCGSSKDTVLHYCIQDFGHGWPSAQKQGDDDQRYGPSPFNATPIIMEFFGKHTLPEINKSFRDEL